MHYFTVYTVNTALQFDNGSFTDDIGGYGDEFDSQTLYIPPEIRESNVFLNFSPQLENVDTSKQVSDACHPLSIPEWIHRQIEITPAVRSVQSRKR